MLDESIGYTQVQQRDLQGMRGQQFRHRAAGTAGNHVFFHGDDAAMGLRHGQDQFFIQWFDEAHVDDRGVEFRAGEHGCFQHGAERHDDQVFALAPELRFADRQRLHLLLDLDPGTVAPRVPDGRRLVEGDAGIEHLAAFVLIGRRHQHEVGDGAHIAEIKTALVGRAIAADQAGPVDREQHRQLLQRDVVNKLVIAALQKCGINRDDGF